MLLVDRSTFPSDIISTHFIHNSGIAHLKSWGLLDNVAASNCPPITQTIFDVGEFALRDEPHRPTVSPKHMAHGAGA